MIKVQRIVVPDTRQRSWVLFNAEQQPLVAPNQYLSYLHCLGRSPSTVRAYAHHLQAFLKFLSEEGRDWKTLTLAQLAQLVAWLRRTHSRSGESRADSTINTVLAAVVPTKKPVHIEIVAFTESRPVAFLCHADPTFLSARLFPSPRCSASRDSGPPPSTLGLAAFEPSSQAPPRLR